MSEETLIYYSNIVLKNLISVMSYDKELLKWYDLFKYIYDTNQL